MEKFERVRELGLYIQHGSLQFNGGGSSPSEYVHASDLEALLAKGVRVNCKQLQDSGLIEEHRAGWIANEAKVWPSNCDTHTGLLINVQPLRKDTAESLLREWMRINTDNGENERTKLVKRTERLLGEK